MNPRRVSKSWTFVALVVVGGFGMHRASAAPPGSLDAKEKEGVQVLTRGPVHEAFAETVTFSPEPGGVAPKAPPEDIEELPPEQKPEGDNVAWIPGYWGWDDERDDFLWVSGTWRFLPPGRQWVSGYWGQSEQGVQWTSGYWADSAATEIEYLPEPPETVEAGPNVDAPSADHAWIPGSWVWQQNRYVWRPGYWAAVQSDWDWIPAHYVWAPRGYIYVDGYWDYSVGRRGVLFAPVYFNGNIYAQQGFSYSPSMVINLAVFGNQLFLRPQYQHYYFGDYYAASYSDAGYYPWFAFQSNGLGYDPFFARQRWQNRGDGMWQQTVQADFQNRREHEDARPPRTLAAQQAHGTINAQSKKQSLVVAAPLDQLAKSKDGPVRFQPLNKEDRQKIGQRGQELRKSGEERKKLEARAVDLPPDKPSGGSNPGKGKLPKSTIVAQSVDRLDTDRAPPKTHQAPKPDPQIEPKSKKVGSRPLPQNEESKVKNAETSKPLRKGEVQPAAKGEPGSTPKDGARPAPKVETKPAPKVGPKPSPKIEPNLAPKVKAKPAPKVEPKKPAPKIEPKPTPRPEKPQDKPKVKLNQ